MATSGEGSHRVERREARSNGRVLRIEEMDRNRKVYFRGRKSADHCASTCVFFELAMTLSALSNTSVPCPPANVHMPLMMGATLTPEPSLSVDEGAPRTGIARVARFSLRPDFTIRVELRLILILCMTPSPTTNDSTTFCIGSVVNQMTVQRGAIWTELRIFSTGPT